MERREGLNYAPESASEEVVKPGEFAIAATHLDHGHIYGQVKGLLNAGATLKWVHDPDPAKVAAFQEQFPDTPVATSLEQILDDEEVKLVTAAAIPNRRGPLGIEVMEAGKDYFTDKSPFTTLEQLEDARACVEKTGRQYQVYYGERLHNAASMEAGRLIEEGAIGRVLQVINIAPHRLSKDKRPDWFFDKEAYGGILTDIGSHQFEQFLTFAGAKDGTVNFARVENFNNPDKPGLEDFGEASLTMDNGASCYCRLDWFTPDGLRMWGDGRVFVVGTEGSIEIRKYIDVGREGGGDRIFLVNGKEEREIVIDGSQYVFRFFGKLILDSLNRTQDAMSQAHTFKAAELSMKAQAVADAARTVLV